MSAQQMQPSTLARLGALRPYPAVSVLAPTHRHEPGNRADPIVLRDLADEAARRVRGELGARGSEEIVHRLREAVASVDWKNPAAGLAVFVAPGESHVLELPFPVAPRIAIDQRFATRDLVRGVARNPRYRVLALGEKPTRLFEGQGSVLVECRTGGFPWFVEGARGEPLESGGFPTHTSRTAEQHRAFFRDVDRALDVATKDEPLPLVVGGTRARPGVLRQRHHSRSHRPRAHRGQLRGCRPGRNWHVAAQPLIDAAVAAAARDNHRRTRRSRRPRPRTCGHQARVGCRPCRTGAGSAGGGRLRVSGP